MNTVSKISISLFLLFAFSLVLSCNNPGTQYSDNKDSTSIRKNTSESNVDSLKSAMTLHPNEEFKLTVFREYPDDKCTSGYLAVNNNIICYTVERPWKDNQENVSSIPPGNYGGIIRYDHKDHWRIELTGVPDRTNVQIHVGNEPDQSKGCILVGERLNTDLCTIKGGTSEPAYKKLKAAFYGTDTPTSTPDKNISVEVVGEGRQ